MAREGHRAALVEGAGRSAQSGRKPVQGAAGLAAIRAGTAPSTPTDTGSWSELQCVDWPRGLMHAVNLSHRRFDAVLFGGDAGGGNRAVGLFRREDRDRRAGL